MKATNQVLLLSRPQRSVWDAGMTEARLALWREEIKKFSEAVIALWRFLAAAVEAYLRGLPAGIVQISHT
jgi:hypothetical protein